jgi:acetyl-CoA acyltransferase
MNNQEAVIVAYGRSACCRAQKGSFAAMHPIDYAAQTLNGILAKNPGIKRDFFDDIIVGCAMPVNQLDMNAARLIALRAGFPDSAAAQTINRFCSSGLQAIATAANAILAGQIDCAAAGGVENMTHCFRPYPEEYQNEWLLKNNIGAYMSMGETAERIADKYNITREQMDRMAVASHAKAYAAQQAGKFSPSIVPVTNNDGNLITLDEGIRPDSSMESLAALQPCFRENGRITAATSSQTSDAAAFVVMMSSGLAQKLGIPPIARLVGFAVTGCDASLMGIGPIYAVPKVLDRTGLKISDMDIIELNEAFASQTLACIEELNLPVDKVNPYGGAIALGHPMGATGAFLTAKALDYLNDTDGKHALITMCIGGGMGAAGIFERLK